MKGDVGTQVARTIFIKACDLGHCSTENNILYVGMFLQGGIL